MAFAVFFYLVLLIPALGLLALVWFALKRIYMSDLARRALIVVLATLFFAPSLAPATITIVVVPHLLMLAFDPFDVAWYREYWQWYVTSFAVTFFVMLGVQALILKNRPNIVREQ